MTTPAHVRDALSLHRCICDATNALAESLAALRLAADTAGDLETARARCNDAIDAACEALRVGARAVAGRVGC